MLGAAPLCAPPAQPVRLRSMQLARSAAATGRAAARWLRLGQLAQQRQVAASSIWHHRNPFDFDELGKGSLAEESPLQSIDEVEHQRKRDKLGHEEAKQAAIKLLAGRPHSQRELRTKLLEKGFGMELIKDALDRLEELGLQSDREFAEVFARSKWRTSKWGPVKLEAELARRGVSREHIRPALQQVFGEEGLQLGHHIEDLAEGSAHSTAPHAAAASWSVASLGSSSDDGNGHGSEAGAAGAAGALLADARRQFERSRGLAMEARKRRLVGWLQRRGHRWDDISKIWRQLEKEAAAQALDEAQSDAEEAAGPGGRWRAGRF